MKICQNCKREINYKNRGYICNSCWKEYCSSCVNTYKRLMYDGEEYFQKSCLDCGSQDVDIQ